MVSALQAVISGLVDSPGDQKDYGKHLFSRTRRWQSILGKCVAHFETELLENDLNLALAVKEDWYNMQPNHNDKPVPAISGMLELLGLLQLLPSHQPPVPISCRCMIGYKAGQSLYLR